MSRAKRRRRVLKCVRCGKRRVTESFSICADGNVERGVCRICDIALNALVMDFMRIPDAAKKIVNYIARKSK